MPSSTLRTLALAACAAATVLATGAAANAEPKRPEPRYVVIREHAYIPFGRQIESWDVVGDHTVLFRTIYNRWYRATTNRVCASEMRSATRIALIDRGGGGSIDRGARIRVDGMSCFFNSLDEIENPYRSVASR
jgi:hypothetical protein